MAKENFNISTTGMVTFSNSMVQQYHHNNKHLRWGQGFYQFMKLERCNTDKFFLDRLYNETDDEKAKAMVRSRTDMTQ